MSLPFVTWTRAPPLALPPSTAWTYRLCAVLVTVETPLPPPPLRPQDLEAKESIAACLAGAAKALEGCHWGPALLRQVRGGSGGERRGPGVRGNSQAAGRRVACTGDHGAPVSRRCGGWGGGRNMVLGSACGDDALESGWGVQRGWGGGGCGGRTGTGGWHAARTTACCWYQLMVFEVDRHITIAVTPHVRLRYSQEGTPLGGVR